MQPVAILENVSKRFRRITALESFSAELMPGEIVGLLGPNGAGKSTLMRLLVGLASPSEGRVSVLGQDMPRHRAQVMGRVGALIEAPSFYEHLGAIVNLRMLRGYYRDVPLHRPEDVLDQVGLLGRESEPVANFSVGMKRRLGLAAALLPSPEVLVLDEPASGLDPEALLLVQRLLRSEAERGVCVLLSSHLLGEVARVCDRVLVLRQGRLVGSGPSGRHGADWIDLRVSEPRRAGEALREALPPDMVRLHSDVVQVRAEAETARAIRVLIEAGLDVHEAAPHRPTLEDYYFDLLRQEDDREVAQ
jgi:ABC-2 type transport system ATP-binding protein